MEKQVANHVKSMGYKKTALHLKQRFLFSIGKNGEH